MRMNFRTELAPFLAAITFCVMLPQAAFASTATLEAAALPETDALVAAQVAGEANGESDNPDSQVSESNEFYEQLSDSAASIVEASVAAAQDEAASAVVRTDYVIDYDPALIEAIGNQLTSGHSICCPSYSCAYADAVLDGTLHDHSYYTCNCCTWPDWGGGGSAFRCVGTDEELLREAYDQISQDRPTVIHVVGPYGEHWIALIGYVGASDPDALTLDNFVALDPADGAQMIASEKYVLYGDGCEHISDR